MRCRMPESRTGSNSTMTISCKEAVQSTWLNRRPMVVASNPVSWQSPVHTLGDFEIAAGMAPYTSGAIASAPKTSINQAPFSESFRAFWNVMIEPITVPIDAAFGTYQGKTYAGTPFDVRLLWAAKANGAGNAMRAGGTLDPGGKFLDPPTFNDPYLGTAFGEFDPLTVAGGDAPYVDPSPANRFDPLVKPENAPVPTDYHPERMFRSSMRAVPDPAMLSNPVGFEPGTPRLNAHEMVVLRAVLAAANAEDLRDSDDDVTAHRIVLEPTQDIVSGGPVARYPADAIVYGTERQPYITEVYADTDVTFTPDAATPPNPYGYVAIELYNPYDQDILLTNWKIVALDRRKDPTDAGSPNPPYLNSATGTIHPGATLASPMHNLPVDMTTLIADFDPNYDTTAIDTDQDVYIGGATWGDPATGPLVVPAHGYLLLENYYDDGNYAGIGTIIGKNPPAFAAGHRPPGTGLVTTGQITGSLWGNARSTIGDPHFVANPRPGLPRLNVACIPGLSGVIDPNWQTTEWASNIRSVMNRELVFLKPRRRRAVFKRLLSCHQSSGRRHDPDPRRTTTRRRTSPIASYRRQWRVKFPIRIFAILSPSTPLISRACSFRIFQRPDRRRSRLWDETPHRPKTHLPKRGIMRAECGGGLGRCMGDHQRNAALRLENGISGTLLL